MSPERQRIAIAEACGWSFRDLKILDKDYRALYSPNGWHMGDTYPKDADKLINLLPDYLNDLNAMHEAENVLTAMQQAIFVARLSQILSPSMFPQSFRMLHATAAQRAEAFLKTLDKWEN